MSIHSFENLWFPIDHFFPGPERWTFGKTSLIVILSLFSLSPSPNIIIINQLFSADIFILHPSTCLSLIPMPVFLAFSLIVHLLPIASSPAVFKHGRRCVPCLVCIHPECFYFLSLFHLDQIEYPCSLSLFFSDYVAFYCGFHYFHFTEIIPIKKWPKIPKAKSLFLPPWLHIWQYC